LITTVGWAQERERTLIHIEHANQLHKTAGSEAVRLIGNVHIRHDSTHFYCDSAYYYEAMNSFDAFQNVHIKINDSIDMYSRTMKYDGNLRFAEFFDNVRMKDDSTLLRTEYMTYDRNRHLASYPHHGITTRGDKQLVSEIGFYRDDMKEFRFFKTVEVTSPKYQMFTDTLYYNTRIDKMWLQGGGLMKNENNQEIEADSMLYDCQKHFTKAVNNIQITDTAYNVIMYGQYAELWEKTGFSFATDSAYVVYYDGGDSLFIASDTMFYHFKAELNEEEKIIGRRHVRFYKSDMQGQCDTMTFLMADSVIRMRVDPVLWTDNSQITGDRIDIKTAHHAIDSLFQKGNAFIISKDSIEGYNQINGNEMVSKFKDSSIDHVNVTESSKVISWLREDDGSLIGINKSSSKNMKILMDDQSISLIKYYQDIDETLYPEKDLKEKDRYLDGFIWREEERPKDKEGIFLRVLPTESSSVDNNP
jgi:lipopolysaccharide export system protein LptA